MKQDLPRLFAENGVDGPVKVVANLPYYITTPILMRLFAFPDLFSDLTLMVQREVGERMAAPPGGKDYGALSVSVQYFSDPVLALSVPPSAFLPQPKVSSVVVTLSKRKEAPPDCADEEYFFSVVKAAFLQRRKTIVNALSSAPQLGVTRETVTDALQRMGLDPMIRGERLSLDQFAALSGLLREQRADASSR